MIRHMGWAAALLISPVLLGCSQGDDAGMMPEPTAVSAQTMRIQSVDVPAHYVTSGTVTSDHRVAISSRLSGYINALLVREGDSVTAGQVLVRVDPVNARQGLVQAEADMADAKADYERYRDLFAARAVSQQQLDRVSLRYKVARSQVEQARNQLSYAEVRAPVSGVVVEKRMNKGDLASPSATILVIDDPKNLLVETHVSEQFVSSIHIGDEADIEIASVDETISGTIRQVVQAADAVSHQFLVKLAVESNVGVHSGMYAQVGFRVGSRKGLLIPAQAVVNRAGLNGVYVVDAASMIRYRQIRPGQKKGTMIEVLAGLRDGDVIAWNGTPELSAGMKLQGQ